MNDLPRQKLCELIANPKYGRTLCDNPQRCEGLLRDFCGQYRAEIFVLVTALKEGVAGELLKSSPISVPQEIVLARLSKRLQDLGMSNKSACWAVNSWALALGVNCQLQESGEEAEFQQQEFIKNPKYEGKLRQYEQEFSTAVKTEYPLTDEVRKKLRDIQQSLNLKIVDVGKIEKPILLQREAEYQKQSAAKIRKELEEVKRQQDSNNENQKFEKSKKFEIFLEVLSASILIISIVFMFQKQQKITGLNGQVYKLNNQLGELKEENESLSKGVGELKEENESLSKEVGDLKKENESLSKELHNLRNVRDNVNDLLNRYSSTGDTYLKFCNKTSRIISAAWAYWDGDGWRSKGWHNPEAGECKEVYVGYNYRNKVYIYSENWEQGDYLFCIEEPSAFNISNGDRLDNCSGSNRKMVKMSEFTVFPGTNTWNFRD
jgi:uncharacterized membrane protein/cell division protein FtsL